MRAVEKRNRTQLDDILELPNYSPAEAARYFHIAPSTLEYWTDIDRPLVALPSTRPKLLSFKNLVELYVLEGLRREGLRTRDIRTAVEYLLNNEKSRHPLADFDLRTLDRQHLVFCRGKHTLNASLCGQYEIAEWVMPYLKRVDRDPHGKAKKIFPFLTKSQIDADADPPRSVLIDPNICFGLPVLAGSRITTGFIASRYRGGDSLMAIANSYDRSVAEIKEAIEWETGKEIRQEAA